MQKGAPLTYTDNGDGTITDVNTGLQWEKKSQDGSIHDMTNEYSWSQAFSGLVATLNSTSFAGHTDWRVPNYKELVSILDLGNISPTVAPAFNNNCSPGCTVLTCSCTAQLSYWSSSTDANNQNLQTDSAWLIGFDDADVGPQQKVGVFAGARAVRGGS